MQSSAGQIVSCTRTFKRVYFSFQSYEHTRLNIVMNRMNKAFSLVKGLKVYSMRSLPTKISKMSIQSSPFVHKKAHDTLEIRKHRRLIVVEGNEDVIRGVIQYVNDTLDASCACRITEHEYHPVSDYYSLTTSSLLPFVEELKKQAEAQNALKEEVTQSKE